MNLHSDHKSEVEWEGFTVIEDVYSAADVGEIIRLIELLPATSPTFRKTDDLFATPQS